MCPVLDSYRQRVFLECTLVHDRTRSLGAESYCLQFLLHLVRPQETGRGDYKGDQAHSSSEDVTLSPAHVATDDGVCPAKSLSPSEFKMFKYYYYYS